jgi:hypothetical protein
VPAVARRVEEVFVRQGWLRDVRIGGRSILTTGEHPFYVLGHGWKRAVELQVGDQVTSHTGQWLPIEANDSTGRFETVYNLRVAQDHTYFVGHDDWGFSVWVHHAGGHSMVTRMVTA